MSEEIRFLGDLERLELKPGDRFVLSCDGKISAENVARIQALWREFAGEDAHRFPLLILDGGMKLGVIAPAPIEYVDCDEPGV